MSAEGKARIAAAQRKRWAAQKTAPRKARFTPEVRKRLAEAMKRRWAAKRAASPVKTAAREKPAEKKSA